MKRFKLPFECIDHQLTRETSDKEYEEEIVVDIALKKLRSIEDAYKNSYGVSVVSADTMVFHSGTLLGKPDDKQAAKRMLKTLSGDWHEVYTGIAVFIRDFSGRENEIRFQEKTRVKFRKMPDFFIDQYVESEKPLDKAGSYGIQDEGAFLIEKIVGDYYNVMGLPIGRLWEVFADFGVVE